MRASLDGAWFLVSRIAHRRAGPHAVAVGLFASLASFAPFGCVAGAAAAARACVVQADAPHGGAAQVGAALAATMQAAPSQAAATQAAATTSGATQAGALTAFSDADWEILVTSPSREVIFTNKRATHFAADSAAREMRSYAGLYTSMHECLDDYVLETDGAALDPAHALRARVWPWLLRREYAGGLFEEVLLPLEEPALLVRLEAPAATRRFALIPRLDMRWIWEVPQPGYEQTQVDGILCFRRSGWAPGAGGLAWLAVQISAPAAFAAQPRLLSVTHPRDAARRAMDQTHPWEPGRFAGAWPARATHVDVVFAQGSTAEEAAARARRLLPQHDALLVARRAYVNGLFTSANLSTGNARLDKAYHWARASLDELLMQTRGPGIYAGFHWFPNYWGRDTFISLPGAALDTGQLDAARAILRSFLLYQNVDRASPRLGRLPNIVQPNELQYAGVDGTWWYVRAAYRYVMARRARGTADGDYERDLAAALRLMVDGAERMAVDSLGLLTHGDGETWMDAGGESHPYSPRGNRAVEVQALYYNALRVGEWLAGEQGDAAAQRRFGALATRTREAFRAHFWDPQAQRLADHLNADGSRDAQVRPNAILAVTAVEPRWPALLEEDQVRAVIDLAWRRLVLPYGLTSLDPSDPLFHPRHLDWEHYFFDAAYHNGDVWYWLSGPMITALCRVGRSADARTLLDPLVAEVLDHGAVGAIQEIRDGGDTGLTEEFGGATFQAWSLAEMIRAMHEDLASPMGWRATP